jgi:hypothetical protein
MDLRIGSGSLLPMKLLVIFLFLTTGAFARPIHVRPYIPTLGIAPLSNTDPSGNDCVTQRISSRDKFNGSA